MSIAEDEAEKRYPDDDESLESYPGERSSDALRVLKLVRNAYIAGRTAEPTETEVEAAAFEFFKLVYNWRCVFPEERVRRAWQYLPNSEKLEYRDVAKKALEAARKAVTE